LIALEAESVNQAKVAPISMATHSTKDKVLASSDFLVFFCVFIISLQKVQLWVI
jgi:hypothetical protein